MARKLFVISTLSVFAVLFWQAKNLRVFKPDSLTTHADTDGPHEIELERNAELLHISRIPISNEAAIKISVDQAKPQ